MSYLKKNLDSLKVKFPGVHEWVSGETTDDPSLELIRTKSGRMNLRVKGLQGKSIHLYDMEDPLAEERELVKESAFRADQMTFLVGIGLGYTIEAVREKMEKGHRIAVIEPDATILRMALTQVDISGLLEEDRIFFSLPDEETLKLNIIKFSSGLTPDDIIIIGNKRLCSLRSQYVELRELVLKYIGFTIVGHTTAFNNGQTFVRNEIENFPKFLFSHGIRNLFNRFEKIPGIIVSAGPSLEKNIHRLRDAQGKALLVATAPVVRVLLAHDIKPDLWVSIDFAKDNIAHFEGLLGRQDIPLVFPLRLAANIVGAFQGPMFGIQDLGGLASCFRRNWEFKGYILGGGSVAIYALVTAIFCGCDPIIFVGQDLAFTDRTHVTGIPLAEKLDPYKTPERYIWVDGMYGKKVPTVQSFLSFQTSIENLISKFERTFINSTEGGVHIKGTEILPLEESLGRYCTGDLDIQGRIQDAQKTERVDFRGLGRDLEEKVKEMEKMSQLCKESLGTNKEIGERMRKGLLRDPETDRVIIENYRTSTEVQKFCESFPSVSNSLIQETFRINRAQYKYLEKEYDQEKDLEVGLERNRLILKAALRALGKVARELRRLRSTMGKIEAKQGALQKDERDSRAHGQYGRVLAAIGLHRLAVQEFERALELGNDSAAVHQEAAKSFLRLEKLHPAREHLRKARERGGNPVLMEEGLKEVDRLLRSWLDKARSDYAQENWVNAALFARKVLAEDPGCAEALRIEREAKTLRDQKRKEIERLHAEEEKERHKEKEYQDLITRGKEAFNQRDFNGAMEVYEKARSLGEHSAEVESLLACCYSEVGEIEKAEKLLRSLCDRVPRSGAFHFNLGRAFIRNGRMAEAASELEKAFAKEKRFYNGLFEAGMIHMNLGDYDKAIQCFERFYERSPDSFEILGKIGTCYLAKGMPQKAKEKYQRVLEIKPDYEPARIGVRKIEEAEQKARLRPAGENPGHVPHEV